MPQIISELWQQRDKAKKEKNKYASNAIKILMNSFFGVLANPTCRFHSLEVANAITHFGQHLIKLTAQKIKDRIKQKFPQFPGSIKITLIRELQVTEVVK